MSLFIHFLEALTCCLVVGLFYRLHNAYKQSLLEDSTQRAFTTERKDCDDGIISAARTVKRQDPVMDLPVMLEQVTEAVNIVQSTVAELEMPQADLDTPERDQIPPKPAALAATDTAASVAVSSASNSPTPESIPETQSTDGTDSFSCADGALNDYIGDFFAGTDSNPIGENGEVQSCNTMLAEAGVDEALLAASSAEPQKDSSKPAHPKAGSRFAVGS